MSQPQALGQAGLAGTCANKARPAPTGKVVPGEWQVGQITGSPERLAKQLRLLGELRE